MRGQDVGLRAVRDQAWLVAQEADWVGLSQVEWATLKVGPVVQG